MKKYLSVFGLFARSSVYKVLGIAGFLCILETGLFLIQTSGISSAQSISRFERYVDMSRPYIWLAAAFILITFVLCVPGSEFGSKTEYTIRRLSVSERAVFYCQAAYNTAVYMFLWAVQVFLLYVFGLWYMYKAPPELVGSLSVFLAFYRDSFMHSVMPLSDIMLWIRNFLLIVSLGFASAQFPYLHRRKKNSVFIVFASVFTLLCFVTDTGNTDNFIFSVILFIITALKTVSDIYRREESYDE